MIIIYIYIRQMPGLCPDLGWVNLCYHALSQTSYLKRGGHIIIFPKLHTFYKTI